MLKSITMEATLNICLPKRLCKEIIIKVFAMDFFCFVISKREVELHEVNFKNI